MKTYKILLVGLLFAAASLLSSCGLSDNALEEIINDPAVAAAIADNSLAIDNNTIVSQAEAE